MAGWHHWLSGRESQWTPGVGDGQGGLACCDSWGHKESDTTEQLIWLIWSDLMCIFLRSFSGIQKTTLVFLEVHLTAFHKREDRIVCTSRPMWKWGGQTAETVNGPSSTFNRTGWEQRQPCYVFHSFNFQSFRKSNFSSTQKEYCTVTAMWFLPDSRVFSGLPWIVLSVFDSHYLQKMYCWFSGSNS